MVCQGVLAQTPGLGYTERESKADTLLVLARIYIREGLYERPIT